jgi:hypothetical protein
MRAFSQRTADWSDAFDDALPDVPAFDAAAHALPRGARGVVDTTSAPLVATPRRRHRSDVLPGSSADPSSAPASAVRPRQENIFLRDSAPPASLSSSSPAPSLAARTNLFLEALPQSEAPPANVKQTRFEQFFMDRMESIRLSTADAFFADLLKELSHDLSVNMCIHVVTQLSLFLAYNAAFVAPFVRSGFLRALELDMQVRFVPHVRMLVACVRERPASVTADMVASVARFNTTRANALKLVKLMEVFLAHAADHPEALRVFAVFLDDPRPYLFCEHFVFFVFRVHAACAAARPLCAAALAKAAIAESRPVARAALAALAHVEAPPVAEVVAAMRDAALAADAVAVLARAPALPPSRRLLACLVGAAPLAPLAVVCLCTLAADPEGAALFLEGFAWLALRLSDAFVVLLSVCLHAGVRKVAGRELEVRRFLARVAEEGSEREVEALAPLIRRLHTDEEFVRGLEAEGFFEKYVPRCMRSESPALNDGAVLVTDRLARIVWVYGFGAFVRELPAIFERGGLLAQKGLVAALVCAVHVEAKRYFAPLGLAKIIAGWQVEAASVKHRDQLLRYLETVEEET